MIRQIKRPLHFSCRHVVGCALIVLGIFLLYDYYPEEQVSKEISPETIVKFECIAGVVVRGHYSEFIDALEIVGEKNAE